MLIALSQIWRACFQRQSRHDFLRIFRKGGVCKISLSGDMHSHECLQVICILLLLIIILIITITELWGTRQPTRRVCQTAAASLSSACCYPPRQPRGRLDRQLASPWQKTSRRLRISTPSEACCRAVAVLCRHWPPSSRRRSTQPATAAPAA